MVTVKEPEKYILIGTAGHIDHGKTELVRSFTGCDTDRLPEEKNRGMSIDLGFASCLLPGNTLAGIVDVPGHEKFIRNMVAGVAAIDAIVLVVAADDGVMPQTREHVHILELLGLRKGLVAVTKIDKVERELTELVCEDVRSFLRGTFLEEAPLVPVSPVSGEGMQAFWNALHEMVASVSPRDERGLFRMPVERRFSLQGLGTVATGMPLTGRVEVNDLVELLPDGKLTRVRGLQVYKKKARRAVAGECVAVNVPELDYGEVTRGKVLAVPGHFRAARMVDAKVALLPTAQHVLKDNAPVRFHAGTAEVMGRAALLDRRRLEPGDEGFVQFRLEAPVVVDPGDRFIFRLQSPVVTVGGGLVLREQEAKLKRFRSYVIEDLKEHEEAVRTDRDRVVFALTRAGASPLRAKDVGRLSKLPGDTVQALLEELRADGELFDVQNFGVVHRRVLDEAGEALLETLGRFHAGHPLREGPEALEVRSELGLDRSVFDLLVRRLAEAGRLRSVGSVLARADFAVEMSPSDRSDLRRVEEAFREAGVQPPSPDEAARALGLDAGRARGFVRLLADRGRLEPVAEDLWFHEEALARARESLVAYLREHGEIGAVSYRDLIGTSRKYAYSLLDYFDVKGVTLRKGNLRYLKGRAKDQA